jgi:GMP synthase (glutamine-hydrolysing)
MVTLRLLVAEGNAAGDRQRIADSTGETPGESYAKVLRALAPGVEVDIFAPADEDAALKAPLEAYDGLAITGSALNLYRREAASLRQVDFVRRAFELAVPTFGSCWGLQLAAVAAGGEVGPNPHGREVAFARRIILTEAGRAHPMHQGRAPAFDAPAIHGDEVIRLPDAAIVTAWNEMSKAQAAEIRSAGGVFWGVQFHPEYDLRDIAATVRRYGARLVDEGFFPDMAALEAYAADLQTLAGDPARRDIAWRFGLGEDVLDPARRRCEIANWIERLVKPTASKRGRA